MTRDVSGTVFFPIRTFSVAWKIRCPDMSWKRGMSRPGNLIILPDFSKIAAYRVQSTSDQVEHFFSFVEIWCLLFAQNVRFQTKLPRYGRCQWEPGTVHFTVRGVSLTNPVPGIPRRETCQAGTQYLFSTVRDVLPGKDTRNSTICKEPKNFI